MWNFGDGEESTEEEPLHRYGAPGSDPVTLEARNQWGSYCKRKVDYIVLYN